MPFLVISARLIGAEYVSSDRNDAETMKPFLDKIEKEYSRRHENVTLDSGYESEENYVYLKERNQVGFIKPQNYEQSKKKKYRSQIGRKENMEYDSLLDRYTCQNGRKLYARYVTKRKSTNGYEQNVTVYTCEDCTDCDKRLLCTNAKEYTNKQISCSRLFEEYRSQSLSRITTEFGTKLRVNRSIQSEGAFAVIKQDYDYRRFSRRGKESTPIHQNFSIT